MKNNLLFDFSVNKKNQTIHVKREFAAHLSLVWDAWTKPELLDLWWAPKPYQTRTKSMDFREARAWLYAMIGPQGDTHWCRADYKKIEPQKNFRHWMPSAMKKEISTRISRVRFGQTHSAKMPATPP